MRLNEFDLSNAAAVQEIVRELGPADGVAFRTYVAVHGPGAPGHCGHKLDGSGWTEPRTVGDAIRFMRAATVAEPENSGRRPVQAT